MSFDRPSCLTPSNLPEREILTPVGAVEVRVPNVRDRSGMGVKFNSALVPPYVRRSQQISAALPWLYLKGVSTGAMREALGVLVGEQARIAKRCSPSTISLPSTGFICAPPTIESTFATVRHRTTGTRNCLSRSTFLGLAFKLVQEAEKTWRRIFGAERIAELMRGVVFTDGVPASDAPPDTQRIAA